MPMSAPSTPMVFEHVSLYYGDGALFQSDCKLDAAYLTGCPEFLEQNQRIFVVPHDAGLAGTLSTDELIELAVVVIVPGSIIFIDDAEDATVRTTKHEVLGPTPAISRKAAQLVEAWVGV